ncbi:HlyB/MsbA family ABC transporter [Russula earlei]|uniref:HlyB/MsbA family ABC transporter n=1 Tax=Russula earlei TaxID=71964 RepID=A0ACC0U7V2_9AGAM|nr:HlyB/MsbA family ABC transporter [Russula earlei]
MEGLKKSSRNNDQDPDQNDSEERRAFKPRDGKVLEHRKIGVWDLYQERDQVLSYFPTSWKIEAYAGIWIDIPYLWRTMGDLYSVAWPLLSLYLALTFVKSLLPALTLWYSGQLLEIIQSTIENHVLDTRFLLQVACGRALCSAADHFLYFTCDQLSSTLNGAIARLDVPTWDDPAVAAQINALFPNPPHTTSWAAILTFVDTVSAFVRMFTQTVVLFSVLRQQRDGLLFAFLTFSCHLFSFLDFSGNYRLSRAWAATTRDKNYIRMEGLKRVINDPKHRKELVAGGLTQYLVAEYRRLANRVGSRAGDFWSVFLDSHNDRLFRPLRLVSISLSELPLIVFAVRAIQRPSSIPISIASLHLMQDASMSFLGHATRLLSQTGDFSDQLLALRKLFEAGNIPNKVADGSIPFPENEQSIRNGISLEFRNVSFQYPGNEKYALRDISFRVGQGQLCVILGSNGSGKSTILKLMARLYDPTEGSILIDGNDIRTLRLEDLRHAMAILFQDYTLFPLTVRENIALGDPTRASDDAAIEQAARLGGASELIARLPDGLDTYIERPVRDLYEGLPDGASIFGGKVDNEYLRGLMDTPAEKALSGGEKQRLAVARTFMRAASGDHRVGLLLFDEPSASLDPTAEQDLFMRLRELRGNKTMIFSTHRFGNLTRHADLILYLNESVVMETGTHEELLRHEGSDYARLWQIQAQAFL